MLKLLKDLKIILSLLLLYNPFVHCGGNWLKIANDARKEASVQTRVQLEELTNAREKHSTLKEIKAALKRSSYERVNADAADKTAEVLATGLKDLLKEKVAFGKKHKGDIPEEDTFIQGCGLLSHPILSAESLIPCSFRVIKVTIDRFSKKTKWLDNLADDQITNILKGDNKVPPNTPELNIQGDAWEQRISQCRFHIQNDKVSHFDYAHLMSSEDESLLIGNNWDKIKDEQGDQILAQVILHLKHSVNKILSDDDCAYFRNKVNDIRTFPNALLLDAENIIRNAKSAEFISDLTYYATEVFGNTEYRSALIKQDGHYSTYIELEAVRNETINDIFDKAIDKVIAMRTPDFDLNSTMSSWPPEIFQITMNDLSQYDLCLLLKAKQLGLALTRRKSKNILVIDYYDVENLIGRMK